ncbi:MAG TPA: trehalose-phosphatase [Allosphingosinicella sp.]|nr:trehalose-phosphatase [Allosphingosinicella sp.]
MNASKAPPVSLLEGAALFLDFDGTLVELAETPGAISVSPGLVPLLRRLSERLSGRLAIVSGRAIADLERHLDCSGVAVSGSHGLELRLAGGAHIPLAGPVDLGEVRGKIERFAAQAPGLLVEVKPASVALHYRQAPGEAERVERFMAALAHKSGLALQPGKMVFELRPRGADKGDAVRAFMAEPEFGGARPLFVGDDLTDEDAFEAAAAMGGAGILVGPPRATAAEFRLADVRAVAAWLEQAAR